MHGVAAVRVDLDGLMVSDGSPGMVIKGMPMDGEFTVRRGAAWQKWQKYPDWLPLPWPGHGDAAVDVE